MCEVRYAIESDKDFWYTLDRDLCVHEFERKIRDRRCYIIRAQGRPVGVMRYNLMWDNTPFLTLIYIDNAEQGKGYGKHAMQHWEDEMRELGYKMVMTSTQVDEQAQHFYRKLGYQERGGIFLDGTPLEQPHEMIMLKALQ